MERFEQIVYSDNRSMVLHSEEIKKDQEGKIQQDLRTLYECLIHFPFIGLVKEKGQTSFEGAAVLAMPPSLQIYVANCSAQSLKAVLKKYYSSLLFKLVCQVHQKRS